MKARAELLKVDNFVVLAVYFGYCKGASSGEAESTVPVFWW